MAIIKAWGFDGFPTVAGNDLTTVVLERGITGTDLNYGSIVTGRGGVGKALSIYTWANLILLQPTTLLTEGCVSLSIAANPNNDDRFFYSLPVDLVNSGFQRIVLRQIANNSTAVGLIGYNLNGSNSFALQTIALPDSVSLLDAPMLQLRWTPTVLELKCNETVIYTRAMTAFTGVAGLTLGAGYAINATYDDIVIQNTATFMPADYRVGVKALESATINDGVVTGAADAHTALASFDGATSYITLNANTDKVVCPVADIEDNPETIHAVLINSSTRKTDTATVTENILVETASSNVVGGDYTNQSLEFGFRQIVLPTDPADSTAWSKAKFNTLSVGVEKKA